MHVRSQILYFMTKIYRCHCGRDREEHLQSALEESSVDGTESAGRCQTSSHDDANKVIWDPEEHLGMKETNAYGDIIFDVAGKKSKAKV